MLAPLTKLGVKMVVVACSGPYSWYRAIVEEHSLDGRMPHEELNQLGGRQSVVLSIQPTAGKFTTVFAYRTHIDLQTIAM
jgi:hypothetical protein